MQERDPQKSTPQILSPEGVIQKYPPLTEEEEIEARNWEGLSEALQNPPVQTQLEEEAVPPLANNKDPQQMKDQMDRLVKKAGGLRKEAGLSASEAVEESSDYKELKSEISRIRYRLNKILEEKGKEKYKEEITELRHELATHLVAFKKLSREKAKENSEKDPEPVIEPEPEPTQTELKKYEQRRIMREEWKAAKETYMNAYEQHLSDVKNKNAQKNVFSKMAFWKKEDKSPALIAAEEAYQDSRNKYAESLDSVLGSRIKTVSGLEKKDTPTPKQQLEGLQAGLANRFVLQAAHEKLAREKEYLPDAKSLRVLEKLQGALKKHKNFIKVTGYVAVVGIALASAGVGSAILAWGSKAVRAKLATVGAASGAALGAYVGNGLSDNIIDYTEWRRDSASKHAQRKWSVETMDKRESDYLKKYRSHEAALRDKGFYVGVGTLAGGTLGAIAAGNLDSMTDIELSDTPDVVPPSAPDWMQQFPQAPDIGSLIPGEGAEEPPEELPAVEPQPVEANEPKIIENFSKEEIFKNDPTIPVVPSDDVTYFEQPATVPEPEVTPEPAQTEPHHHVPESTEEVEPSEDADAESPELLHTFEPGRVDTVSEALFEAWKADNDTLEESVTKKEFLAEMYGAIAEMEKNPALNAELMEQMGIESGDIDEVQLGDTIDLQPFFEYMNQRN